MLGPRLPQIGLSFVPWHQTPGSLTGGWAFNQNILHLKYSMQIFDEHVSGQPLIRKHSDLTIHVGTWGDSLLYCGIIHQGPFPGMGLEVKV